MTDAFRQMRQKQKVEKDLHSELNQIWSLSNNQRFAEAEKKAFETANTIQQFFPPDHYHMVLLYHRQAKLYKTMGKDAVSNALSHVANYLDEKLKYKHEYNKSMGAHFPQFPFEVLQMIYSEDVIGDFSDLTKDLQG